MLFTTCGCITVRVVLCTCTHLIRNTRARTRIGKSLVLQGSGAPACLALCGVLTGVVVVLAPITVDVLVAAGDAATPSKPRTASVGNAINMKICKAMMDAARENWKSGGRFSSHKALKFMKDRVACPTRSTLVSGIQKKKKSSK